MLRGSGDERSARAVRRRPAAPGHDVGDVRRPARRRRPRVPGRHGPRRRAAAGRVWTRCGTAPASAASISTTSIGPPSTRSCTSCSAARSRRPRSPRSGRPAAATSCSCASSCSAPSTVGCLVDQHGVWRLDRPARHHAATAASWSPPGSVHWSRQRPTPSTGWRCGSRRACRRWRGSSAAVALEVLDRAGLLAVRVEGRRQIVTLAHPLYGEILRARMPALTRRRLLLEHADHIDALGARRREDTIRSAIARLEASGSADPQLLVRAGPPGPLRPRLRHASSGSARAALRDGMTSEIGLLVGEALHELRHRSPRPTRCSPPPRQRRPRVTRSSSTSPRSAPAT